MTFYGDISGAKEFSAINQTRWKRTTTTSCWKDIDLGETIYYCGLQTSLASHCGVCKQTKRGFLPTMQIMVALRVFALGGFQLDVGDTFGTNEAIITFNIITRPSEHTEHYSCCF